MEQSKTLSLREGDVYRWRYNTIGSQLDLHWCCACIGIVSNGRIVAFVGMTVGLVIVGYVTALYSISQIFSNVRH